jgi:hypothetical protein
MPVEVIIRNSATDPATFEKQVEAIAKWKEDNVNPREERFGVRLMVYDGQFRGGWDLSSHHYISFVNDDDATLFKLANSIGGEWHSREFRIEIKPRTNAI